MKKDFYIYKCLREIHRLNQNKLIKKEQNGILLILNTPGSLEHFMVHTDPDRIQTVFDTLLNYSSNHLKKGSIKFGYRLGRDEQLSFYVNEPSRPFSEQSSFENEFNAEADLIATVSESLSGLGGSMWIDNNSETGRTFWFSLDIRPPENSRNGENREQSVLPNPDWSDRTFLIVDDVYTNLILLEGLLTPTKARVHSVDNGLKAVNAVKKNASIDFVLMDVRMPVLDGYEATRRIKRIKPWLPVVAISAYPSSAETERWKLAGCDAFLGKPLNSNDLIQTIHALLKNVAIQA